jgi:hypothetical protein
VSNFRILLMGGVACLALAVAAAIYLAGASAGAGKVQRKWDVEKIAHARALLDQEAAHRAQERRWGEATAKLTESLRGAQEALQDDYENTIADMRSGALRLRNDLRGCRAQLPGDPPTPSGDHGAGGGGLSEARQELALRIGAECDAVVNRLTAAQEYIKEIQGGGP